MHEVGILEAARNHCVWAGGKQVGGDEVQTEG